MTTTKIDELADMIRLLRDKLNILVETGNDDQYTEAVITRRLLLDGLRNLEDLAVVVVAAETLAAEAEFLEA